MPTFPITNFQNLSLRSQNPTRVTSTINGIEQRSSLGAQYYQLTATFQNLTQSDQRKLLAFIDEMRGPLTGFDLQLPSYLGNSTGAYSGSISVATNTAAGQTSIPITTAAANGVTVLKAGDLIRFSNHNKVYAVKADVVAVSGNETLTLSQPLRTAVTTSHTITHKTVSIFVRFSNEINEFQMDANLYPTFSIDFQEVLS